MGSCILIRMKDHACEICHASFDSGRELGSHKSTHSKKQCPSCFENVQAQSFKRHVLGCEKKIALLAQIRICKLCGKQFDNRIHDYCSGACSHSAANSRRTLSPETKQKIRIANEGKKIAKREVRTCKVCNEVFETKQSFVRDYCFKSDCSKKAKSEILSKALKGKSGGVRQGGGHGKHGRYKGIWCDSSWELAWVIYAQENGIQFKRNTKGFEYIFNEKKFRYFPDFELADGSFLEIKGYDTAQSEEKHRQFPGKLQVLKKKDMLPIIDYVMNRHGKEYTVLYEQQ